MAGVIEDPPRYWLRRHVFACDAGRYRIFLDLLRDRYCSVARERVLVATQALAASGLLTLDPAEGHAKQTVIERPMVSLRDTDSRTGMASTARSPLAIAVACTRASWTLRFSTLHATVERVARRKRECENARSAFDWERASAVVRRFKAWRSWFPRDHLCLFDSLALLECLAREGLYPQWVFGVYPEPFEAHCWLQQDAVVLNDTVDEVRPFTPILVI
jgi:hypothetical protein